MAPEALAPAPVYEPGNRDDFDRLYRDSYQRILKTLIAVVGDRAAAEDCTQDTFVQAFRAWSRWKPDAPAEAWLHRIALRVAISYRRRARLRALPELLRRVGPPSQAAPEQDVETTDEVLSALREMPIDHAAALVLRHHHGYSNRELAIALGIKESTVATRLSKGRERLAQALGRPEAAQLRPKRSARAIQEAEAGQEDA